MPSEDETQGWITDPGASNEVHRNTWEQTLDEMDAIAANFQTDGWTTLATPIGHTAPEPPDLGTPDRYGLVYTVPGNFAEEFAEVFADATFPEYDVFRNDVDGREFLVLVLLDSNRRTAVLLAGTFERQDAKPLIRAVTEHGRMYVHLRKLDGTHLATFEHEDYEKFFPHAERLLDEGTGEE